jgi:hypothetical protein
LRGLIGLSLSLLQLRRVPGAGSSMPHRFPRPAAANQLIVLRQK